jgi:hypothetical protein
MTPHELLTREPSSIEHDFSVLAGTYFNFIPEVGDDFLIKYRFLSTESPRIEICVFKHFAFDSRRFWRLAAVYFDGEPVMITQNAGREGDDHAHRFILDRKVYDEMIRHIVALPRRPEDAVDDGKSTTVTMDEDLGERLTSFYGDKLDGYFSRHY